METKKYYAFLHWIWLTHRDLFEIFWEQENPKEVFENISESFLVNYIQQAQRRDKIIERYSQIKTQSIEKVLEKLNVEILLHSDIWYPQELLNIPHTPFLLYVRWSIPSGKMFWVVGSRKISSYGKKCIEHIIPDISKVFSIVSGGAAGCDTQAHKTTLQQWQKTVVVIWTGIDQIYPVMNAWLFEEVILKSWAIISIFPIGEPGNPYNFPVRNEIVVWLSQGILIVEAQEKSWTMITAGLCLDLWKDLFAIPWDIFHSWSSGTNMLIKKWEAKSVTLSTDVLEEYDVFIKQSQHRTQIPLLDTVESQIYSWLCDREMSIDDIIKFVQLPTSQVGMKVSLLELKKLIKKNMNGKYQLA